MKTRKCPCGCGQRLVPYNGTVPLVCYTAWQQTPKPARSVVMFSGSTDSQRRAAVREILGVARKIRTERGQGQLAI